MKRFLIKFKEVSYGVVEVFAEKEDQARDLAKEYDSTLLVDTSELELGELVSEEEIGEEYNLG